MSKVDYSSLINEDEVQTPEEPVTFNMTRSSANWYEGSSDPYNRYNRHYDGNVSMIDEYKIIHLDDKQINITQEENPLILLLTGFSNFIYNNFFTIFFTTYSYIFMVYHIKEINCSTVSR